MPAAGTMYLTTSTGYPYTYHNGVAYFHTPEVTSVPPSWPVSNFHFRRVTTNFFKICFIPLYLINFAFIYFCLCQPMNVEVRVQFAGISSLIPSYWPWESISIEPSYWP